MVFQMPDRGGPPYRTRVGPVSRRAKTVLLTAFALFAVLVAFVLFAGVWTDWLWFRSVHYTSVYRTRLLVELGLFGAGALLMAAACGFTMWLAHWLRPPLSAMSPEQRGLDRYRAAIAPYRGRLLLGVSLLAGLPAGAAAAGQWRLWLLWRDGTPFGVRDGQFHLDVAFYTFDLPWYQFLVRFGFGVLVVSVLAALLVHYLYGGLRLQGPGRRAGSGAQAQLAVLLGALVLLKAAAYWLDRYALALKSGAYQGVAGYTGLRYVDANAYLPGKTVLFFVALICAALFFLTPVRRSWAPALLGCGLMALSAVLLGGLYPALVQQFQVKPHEQAKEAPYLRQNIDATRQAYGIADTQTSESGPSGQSGQDGPGGQDGQSGGAAQTGQSAQGGQAAPALAAQTARGVQLLDPALAAPAFRQLQQQHPYYGFPGTLDVDRYPTPQGPQDTVIGVRELDLSPAQQRDWTDDHIRYTHGYGVAAAQGDQVDGGGGPVFTESGLPAAGPLGDFQQRVYYGERTTDYAIVDGGGQEVDDSPGYRYQGDSGVPLDGPVTRAAYAVRFDEPRFLTSAAVGHGARLLYDRTPRQRVTEVAPWLTLDGDPYPVVQDGRLLWVLDGYTTSDAYPFSSRTALDQAAGASGADQVNYVRDSVKATVDAYSGAVTLYQWDEQDPVLKTWMKAFPGTVLPRTAVPAGLLPHLRYPQDLFAVQRELLARYHVTDPDVFFQGAGAWQVPADPTGDRGRLQPPTYQTVRMPQTGAAAFSLTGSFVPSGGQNLAAFMAVDSDPGPDYGTIRLLQLPGGSAVPGPGQAQARFTADPGVAAWLRGAGSGGATVEYGRLLTVPVGDTFLQVEPVYVTARGARYPVLRRVLAQYGTGPVAFQGSLDGALTAAFGEGGTAPSGAADPALRKALDDADRALTASQDAVRTGDWAEYGAAQQALRSALNAATAAASPPGGPGLGGTGAGGTGVAAAPPPSGASP